MQILWRLQAMKWEHDDCLTGMEKASMEIKENLRFSFKFFFVPLQQKFHLHEISRNASIAQFQLLCLLKNLPTRCS